MLSERMPPDVDLLKVDVPSRCHCQYSMADNQSLQAALLPGAGQQSPQLCRKRQLDYEMMFDRATLEPDSDIHALRIDRVVSVSPISLDMTARVALEQLEISVQVRGEGHGW